MSRFNLTPALTLLGWLFLTGAAMAAQTPPDNESGSVAAMDALGRGGKPTYMVGETDMGAYCQRHFGATEAGFDQASQRYYCKTEQRWVQIVPIDACREQFGEVTLADAGTGRCYRLGGEDPGPNVPRTQSGPVHVIKPGTVDQTYGREGPQVIDGANASQLTASQVAQSGAAERVGGTGPLQVWNQLPLFLRVMIFGGGFLIVGLWAGGYAVRLKP